MKVKDVFTLNNDFKSFKLLAGECGVENEIKSVDIMEVPDGVYWVKPGDFIITTGFTLTKNDTTIDNIVQMMIARGAAALGIKLVEGFEAENTFVPLLLNRSLSKSEILQKNIILLRK